MYRPLVRAVRRPRHLVVLLASFLLSGCAATQPAAGPAGDRQAVWSSDHGYVWLAASDARDGAGNDHPLALAPDEVRERLAVLQAETRPGGGLAEATGVNHDGPVFTEDMLDRLAEPVSRAFARAAPDQDVVVSIRGFRQTPGAGRVGNTVVTSARLFHRDDALQVIVGELNERIETEFPFRYSGPTDLDARGSKARHGNRAGDSQGRRWQLVETDATRLAEVNGRQRSDWALLGDAAVGAAMEARSEPSPDESAPAAQPGESDEPAAEPSPEPETGIRTETEAEIRTEPSSVISAEQRQELRELRDLHEEGLLPEPVYHERVRDVLDSR